MKKKVDIYPMPSFPSLLARDLRRSRDFYVETLGFLHVFSMPGQDGRPVLEHVRFCRYADVLLQQAETDLKIHPGNGITITFSATLAGRTCDQIAEQVRKSNGRVEGPVERPWNVREVRVTDPDGYVLLFVEPLDINKSMDDVMTDVSR